MKRLLLVLVLIMTAGSLFAAELKIDGDMYVRGSTLSNMDLEEDDEATFSYFDYELNINAALVVNEKATVYTKLTYDKDINGSGVVADGDGTANTDALSLERAYINYKFHPALQLNTGLMSGGQWGTTFGDTEINVMRVQAIGALSKDMVFIATYEKQDEAGYDAWGSDSAFAKDFEKDDTTVYYLGSKMVFGNITVLPLLTYATKGLNNDQSLSTLGITDTYTYTKSAFTLALKGDFGMFGFEAEGVYIKADADGFEDDNGAILDGTASTLESGIAAFEGSGLAPGDAGYADAKAGYDYAVATLANVQALQEVKDATTYGLYVNLFAKVDALKAGFIYAYGSADEEDGSYNWGDDFDLFVVMDDYIFNTYTDGLTGFSAYKLYADYTMDKITVMVGAGYGASNMSGDDASFMEGDIGASYAFDENTAYSVMFGYAKTSDFYADGVDADAYRLYHKFAVKF
jgi:hypothetical protein